MPDDPYAQAVAEVVKHLPVRQIYNDVGSGAVKQLGHSLTDVAKTVRLALFPFQMLGALQDRAQSFLDRSIRRVPEDRRISPAPQIIGPVLEGIRYEPEGTPIDEMFSLLLSRSMDGERVNEAHPSFPILIRQLCADEAKILMAVKDHEYDHVHTRDFNPDTALFYGPSVIEIDDLPRDNLTFPSNIPFYFQHLDKLGLAGIFQHGNQEPLFNEESTRRHQIGVRVRSKYQLTDFGRRFVQACAG
jgi:Abortive infection alpha